MLPTIQLYNTLSGTKSSIVPIKDNHISIYACGVTVYDHCHIGHALQALYFDSFRQYLIYRGYKVTYVRNFTDVDDKIIDRAAQQNISPKALAQKMIASTIEDLEAFAIKRGDVEPLVSESIPEIIAMIETLIRKDMAYATKEGSVYYRVKNKKDYGKLSKRNIDELLSGTRDITHETKENSLDFALWKQDITPDASWQSPWGIGRPGWHIECSAMAAKHLGPQIDIHGGGLDLVFPHHENEIAQSESANGCTYAQHWMHSGLLTINKQKMSKSLGNQITIKDFLKQWPAEVFRFLCFQTHYRSPIDFSPDLFLQGLQGLLYFYDTLGKITVPTKISENEARKLELDLHTALDDDFSTPLAIGYAFKAIKRINQLSVSKKKEDLILAGELTLILKTVFQPLGLFQQNPAEFCEKLRLETIRNKNIELSWIEGKIAERLEARNMKNWELADIIRKEIKEKGILLQDRPNGTDWTIEFLAPDPLVI